MNRLIDRLNISPLRYALLCAFLYFIIAATWIRVSSELAGSASQTVSQLEQFEILKGLAFVFATSALFFVFSFSVFRHMAGATEKIVRSQQNLAQAEREAIMGVIASSVAHDLNNMLAVVSGSAYQLATSRDLPESLRKSVDRMSNAVQRMSEITTRLKSAGRDAMKSGPVRYDFCALVQETMALMRLHRSLSDCEIGFEAKEPIEVVGYPVLVHQMLMNLLINAGEATGGHGRIQIVARKRGSALDLHVLDDGPGVSPLLRTAVFDAFFSTKKYGTGLGLVSVKNCVEMHGGKIEIRESSLGGAEFVICLPDVAASASDVKLAESLNKNRSFGILSESGDIPTPG